MIINGEPVCEMGHRIDCPMWGMRSRESYCRWLYELNSEGDLPVIVPCVPVLRAQLAAAEEENKRLNGFLHECHRGMDIQTETLDDALKGRWDEATLAAARADAVRDAFEWLNARWRVIDWKSPECIVDAQARYLSSRGVTRAQPDEEWKARAESVETALATAREVLKVEMESGTALRASIEKHLYDAVSEDAPEGFLDVVAKAGKKLAAVRKSYEDERMRNVRLISVYERNPEDADGTERGGR